MDYQNIKINTIVPRVAGIYASFPTFTLFEDDLFLFYRLGLKGDTGTHGSKGRVHRLRFNIRSFLEAFAGNEAGDLFELGEDRVIFAEHNEMDGIVSRPGPNLFCLATRTFDEKRIMRSYLSFSETPEFGARKEISLPELEWLAFYGKALSTRKTHVFPAYGALKGESFSRPLLLASRDFRHFELLAHLPSRFDGKTVLNESSIAYYQGRYHIFMREDSEPFGLWYAVSPDLLEWSTPRQIMKKAHAPAVVCKGNRLLLCFRHILGGDRAATAIMEPLAEKKVQDLDHYKGNIYDGGYSDPGMIGDNLFVFYYHGNTEGEPLIKACRLG